MKSIPAVYFVMSILVITACAPQAPAPPASVATQASTTAPPTATAQSSRVKTYSNHSFGLGFQYPSDWFGPDEDVSGQTLRVEVGSDVVYPYGQPPEQPSGVKNSYNVVIQYTEHNQNPSWRDTYQSLLKLKDGESLSGARNLIIRVRQLGLEGLKGFEYISTLSETAQTDHVYARQVVLFDEQTNDLLTIIGQPINVDTGTGSTWRDAYRAIDQANLLSFHEIVDSITTAAAKLPNGAPAACPTTQAPNPAFAPRSPYPASPPDSYAGMFWYGTPDLWTMLSLDGTWSGLPQSGAGYTQKVFWWRQGYDMDAEPNPKLTVTGKRLDAQAPPLLASHATNASADFGQAMLVGVDVPTLGCWEITGHYNSHDLSFVVWIAP